MFIKEDNMLDKIKSKIVHYWTDHKEVSIVITTLLVIFIILQEFIMGGDLEDGLQIYGYSYNTNVINGFFRWTNSMIKFTNR